MEITLRPTKKQHEAYMAMNDPEVDTIFLGGGAGGGKSWWICESRLINAIRYPGYKSFIGREELKRLMQSTFQTFVKVSNFHKIPEGTWHLNGQYNYIEFSNGSRIDLLDLKFLPTDPFYERFGSLEYTDGAIEEAGEVDFMAYDVLKTRVGRHMNKELGVRPTLAITANPKDNWVKRIFWVPWASDTLPKNIKFIQSLYRDNPHTAESYGKQLDSMSDENNKARLKDGNWNYDNDPQAMIKPRAISDLWINTLSQRFPDMYSTADIARFGSDRTVIFEWRGLLITKAHLHIKQSTAETETRLSTILRDSKISYERTVADEDGVGGGVVDHLEGIVGFVANSSPLPDSKNIKRENYENLKTQCAYKLADYVNRHQIGFAPDFQLITNDPEITVEKFKDMVNEELKQLKTRDIDDDRTLKIVRKEEIKATIGRSPDILDNFIMRMRFEIVPPEEGRSEEAIVRNAIEKRRNLAQSAR